MGKSVGNELKSVGKVLIVTVFGRHFTMCILDAPCFEFRLAQKDRKKLANLSA